MERPRPWQAGLAATCGIAAALVWFGVVVVATREQGQPAEVGLDATSVAGVVPAPATAAPVVAARERRERLMEQMARVGVNERLASIGPVHSVTDGPSLYSVMTASRDGMGMLSAPPAEKRMGAQLLPPHGVLATTFVGGDGVVARLDDLLDRGVVVDGQEVRLQAFEDRDPLPYPVPADEGVAMYASLERARVHASGDRVHLQIALVARRGEAPARPRMDVRLVLDRSGSMSGEKWASAVAAAHALVDRLGPGDSFGLVSYADDATLDAAPGASRAAAHQAIDRLSPDGRTNIGAALDLVAHSAPTRRGPGDVALVVLVSDGRVTTGEASPAVLAAKARAMFDGAGVLTTAVGLGPDFDEETMLAIAREGSGSYHFVRRPADVGPILDDELVERAEAVAQALRVKVVLGSGVVARKVYGSRLLSDAEHEAVRRTEVATDARLARELGLASDRRDEDAEGLQIHLPTFRRGDQHVILMELEVPRGAGTASVASVTLDYKDLLRKRNASIEQPVTAARSADREAVQASTDRLVKRTVLAFQAGDALQAAGEALAAGDVAQARRLLDERRDLLVAGAGAWRDPALARDASLLDRYVRVLASAYPEWNDGDRRTLELAMGAFADRRLR